VIDRFQVDQCLDSRKLVGKCNSDRPATVRRFPDFMRNQDDPDVVEFARNDKKVLLSGDTRLLDDWAFCLNDHHFGVIVVIISLPKTLTWKNAIALLAVWKACIHDWHSLSFDNSVLELREEYLQVFHVERSVPVRDEVIFLKDPEACARLVAALERNRKR
jgi:hypothetical protein